MNKQKRGIGDGFWAGVVEDAVKDGPLLFVLRICGIFVFYSDVGT